MNKNSLSNRILSQSIFAQITNSIIVFFSLLKTYFLSKALTLEEFGVLSLLLTITGFLLYFLTLGTFQYIFKTVAADPGNKINSFWSSMIVTLTLSVVTLSVTAFFLDDITSYLNLAKFKNEFLLILMASVTTSLFTLFSFYIYAQGRNNTYNLTQLFRNAFWILLVLIYCFLFKSINLLKITIIINISIFAILIFSIFLTDIGNLMRVKLRNLNFKPLFDYCLPLIPYLMSYWGIAFIVRGQLNISQGGAMVALYSVIYGLMEFVLIFSANISSTFAPYFYAADKDNQEMSVRIFCSMLRYCILIILILIPFLYVLRHEIIIFLTKAEYLASLKYLPYLIILPFIRAIVLIFHQYYLKHSKTLYLGIIYSVALGLTFLLSKILIPNFSIYGAVFTVLIVYFFLLICFYSKLKHMLDNTYLRIGPMLKFILLLLISVIALEMLPLNRFLAVLPLTLMILLGLAFIPVLADNEKDKLRVFLKLRGKP